MSPIINISVISLLKKRSVVSRQNKGRLMYTHRVIITRITGSVLIPEMRGYSERLVGRPTKIYGRGRSLETFDKGRCTSWCEYLVETGHQRPFKETVVVRYKRTKSVGEVFPDLASEPHSL